MKTEKIFAGQILYLETKTGAEEVKVAKVGKKYFYLEGPNSRLPVDKQTLQHTDRDYSQRNFQLYFSEKDVLERKEKETIYRKLMKHFDWSGNIANHTLEQLCSVSEILGIK